MLINHQLYFIFFATFVLASVALAEENLDLNTHLAYVQPVSAVPVVPPAASVVPTPATDLPLPASNLPNTNQTSTIQASTNQNSTNEIGTSKIVLTNDSIKAITQDSASGVSATNSLPSTTDQAEVPTDLWQRIRNGFGLPELKSKLIAHHEKWYANHPDYVARMAERSQRYLYYITQEVERRGMPSEIALLPVIESAFNPGAYSVGHASGIWQFISSTGKNFGMQQNWWYDGRRDIISATNGALDYLQQLHDQFGDWELALAAYNWGEGAVSRAQSHNRRLHKPTDFASLRLPLETRNYVPKLLAVKHIVNDPEHFGLKLASIPNQPYFAAVTTQHPIDVKLAAELADISMDEFLALNPGHNRPVILQDNATMLLLPVDKLETFQTNLEKYSLPLVSWQPYQTKKGERFDQLAPRFGLSTEKLRSINGLSARAKISSGQTLLVPLNSEEHTDSDFPAFNTNLVSIDDSDRRSFKHTVRRGESISIIAHHYHISQARLLELNSGLGKLRVGQRLTVEQSTGHRMRRSHIAKSHSSHNTKLVRNSKAPKPNSAKVNMNVASTR